MESKKMGSPMKVSEQDMVPQVSNKPAHQQPSGESMAKPHENRQNVKVEDGKVKGN